MPEKLSPVLLKVDDVSWFQGNTLILDKISWEVKKQEHWAFIGLNGSGKTSLLNILCGYIYPSKGSLEVLGKTFGSSNLRELRKSIGCVSSSLQEKIPGKDNVLNTVVSGRYASLGLYDSPTPKELSKARTLLRQFDCLKFSHRTYATLSQGEKQKVLIMRALMASPQLLILDEPTVGLDPFARKNLLTLIEGISKLPEAPVILYVSHYIEEILPLFTHTLLLRKGKIHSQGKKEKILTEANLSDFFETPVKLIKNKGRYELILTD